jgi:site-specific DNA recombinase
VTRTDTAGSVEKNAVVYLRVSTTRQLDTAADVDPDGNSIATQRQVCQAKADKMGVSVQQEFLEPGTSAQTIEKRAVFRQLLAYVSEHPEIDYVVIYMRSRAFRNLGDAVVTKRRLEKLGVKLVSAKEDFGEGIMADAMEAVTDIINEVQVRMSGEDIKVKMQHKAQQGGTNGRARIGYRNVRIDHEGQQVNSIAVDPERAPLILKAWELYATGDYSLERLYATMADLGLTTRPTRRWPSQPVSLSKLHRMLRDPYYTGVITYKGETFVGRHPAIVSQELFDRVQEVMDARSQRGQRDRVLYHYLKGIMFCARCRAAGRTSRMIYTEAQGRGGVRYEYFLCRGRQDGFCDLPHLRAEQVEDEIVRHYATLALPSDFGTAIRDLIQAAMADEQSTVRELHDGLRKQLAKLDVQEERLLDLAADDALPRDKIRARLRKIQIERQSAQQGLSETTEQLALGAQILASYLDLLADPQALYTRAPDESRRTLNQAFYERLFLDDHGVQFDVKTAPVAEFHEAVPSFRVTQPASPVRYLRTSTPATEPARAAAGGAESTKRGPSIAAGASFATERYLLADVFTVDGSSKHVLVGLTGFEPATP